MLRVLPAKMRRASHGFDFMRPVMKVVLPLLNAITAFIMRPAAPPPNWDKGVAEPPTMAPIGTSRVPRIALYSGGSTFLSSSKT